MIRSAAILCAGALAIVSPFLGILPGWTPALATTTALTALSLVGLNLIFGVVGMLAFGQAAFMVIPAGHLQELVDPASLRVQRSLPTR